MYDAVLRPATGIDEDGQLIGQWRFKVLSDACLFIDSVLVNEMFGGGLLVPPVLVVSTGTRCVGIGASLC